MTICKISCLFMYLVVGGSISEGGQNKIEAAKQYNTIINCYDSIESTMNMFPSAFSTGII